MELKQKQIQPYPLRMDEDLRIKLERNAALNRRSLNSEIVARLEQSCQPPDMCELEEAKKLEVVANYVDWCNRHNADPQTSFVKYALASNSANLRDESAIVKGGFTNVGIIDYNYLYDLYHEWIINRPNKYSSLIDDESGFNVVGENGIALATNNELLMELMRRLGPGMSLEIKKS